MKALLASLNPVWMFLAGCGILTYLLLKRSHRYFGKSLQKSSSRALELQTRPTHSWDGVQRDSLARVERQKVELHDMARELTGQITTKMIVLEQLIADSERQIKRMEQLLDQSEEGEGNAVSPQQEASGSSST